MAQGKLNQILAILKKNDLLLEADANLPSVATLIAGEPIKGSWWGHPARLKGKGKVEGVPVARYQAAI